MLPNYLLKESKVMFFLISNKLIKSENTIYLSNIIWPISLIPIPPQREMPALV